MNSKSFLPPAVSLAEQDGPEDRPGKSVAAIEAHGGTVTFVTAADGVILRTAHFPAPSNRRPAMPVLFLNGRTDFIEKNLETVNALHRRGHAVWTFDWRGQGGSERLLDDPAKGHVPSFDLFLDDVDRFVDEVVRPDLHGQRLVLLAHSMGGNIGMRLLERRPDLFERAIFTAPMISFTVPRAPNAAAHVMARIACKLGKTELYAPGNGPNDSLAWLFDANRLTTCRDRFERTRAWLQHDRNLHLGGITWGWLRAALDSVRVVERTGLAEAIDLPVLVLVAGEEKIVDNRAIIRFVERLPQGRLLRIDGARHELLLEADGPREKLWEAIDGFLAEADRSGFHEATEMDVA